MAFLLGLGRFLDLSILSIIGTVLLKIASVFFHYATSGVVLNSDFLARLVYAHASPRHVMQEEFLVVCRLMIGAALAESLLVSQLLLHIKAIF